MYFKLLSEIWMKFMFLLNLINRIVIVLKFRIYLHFYLQLAINSSIQKRKEKRRHIVFALNCAK